MIKRILLSFFAVLALLTAALAPAQVVVDPAKAGFSQRDIGDYAYAALPAASAYTGKTAYATNLGANGSVLQSNGTRWRAVNGTAVLKALAAPVSGVVNSETIVLQTLIPAGAWQTNDTIRIWISGTKSGSTDAYLMSARIGTAGTTADTVITGLSAFSLMTATGLTGGAVFDIKLLSATSVQRTGGTTSGQGTYTAGSSSGAIAAATTISDASANALYVSVSIYSGGASNTVAALTGQIQLITP